MSEGKFIRIDGDNIGDKIEFSLLNEDYEEAQNLHHAVQNSLSKIVEKIKQNPYMKILMYGSDDVLFFVSKDFDYRQFLEKIREDFFHETKCTLSIGIGNTMIHSINNLRRAKLSGKNKIEEENKKV